MHEVTTNYGLMQN